ncbi:MAG: DUF86 domain-containing protein [Pasteurellaceae bacterium]|nr:DUF86 domain-containing protein [Pasteurellaceae bacterium]
MNERTLDYLTKIQQLCLDILTFIDGLDKEEFLDDTRTQNAVAMSLITMGKIVTVMGHKDPDFIAKHTHIPWRYIKGMRNVIAHGYFELDFEIVWETAQHSIPELLGEIENLIEKLFKEP